MRKNAYRPAMALSIMFVVGIGFTPLAGATGIASARGEGGVQALDPGTGQPSRASGLDPVVLTSPSTGPRLVHGARSVNAAANLLVAQGSGYPNFYGSAIWSTMTAAINSVATSVTVTPDLENLAYMLTFGALWVDQRLGGALTANEVANISAFIATGRRVVLIGENNAWSSWNSQILGIVGGSYSGTETGFVTLNPVVVAPLTAGVTSVYIPVGGLAVGGTPVFDQNIITLWGASSNVLTHLDSNGMDNTYWSNANNPTFYQNLACWVACSVVPVELQSFNAE